MLWHRRVPIHKSMLTSFMSAAASTALWDYRVSCVSAAAAAVATAAAVNNAAAAASGWRCGAKGSEITSV